MSVRIVLYPHPFRQERKVTQMEAGKTIDEIIQLLVPGFFGSASIIVNDHYGRTEDIPNDDDLVVVRLIPEGMDAGDATKAIGGAQFVLGGILMFTPLAAFGPALMVSGAATFVSGVGIKQGWFLPDMSGIDSLASDTTTSPPQIRGSRNQAAYYKPIPVVLGKHLVTPPYAAKPYTLSSGYALRQLFVVGYNNLRISKIKIKDTELINLGTGKTTDYDSGSLSAPYDCKFQILFSSALAKYYPDQVDEESLNIEVPYGTTIIRDTTSDIDEINVNMIAPTGLCRFKSDGTKERLQITYRAYYKVKGASDSTYVEMTGHWLIGSSTEACFNTSEVRGLTRGQYTVKILRETPEYGTTEYNERIYVWSIQGIRNEDPIDSAIRNKITRIALYIKATKQLNGIIDQLNVVAESIVPNYLGSGSGAARWTNAVTSNPASLYLFLLRGEQNPDPVIDADIDWPAFETWHTFCASKSFTCNMVINTGSPLEDNLKVIASCGRATPLLVDGKYSILVETERSTAIQMFTPRNSRDFSGAKAFRTYPHALKIRFIDASMGWQENECVVYDDGYSVSNATIFESVSLPGVTNYNQAWKLGRYIIAEARLRPEIYTLTVDFEYLRCTRGDLVVVNHDVLLVGKSAGRIKSLVLDESDDIAGIVCDELFSMTEGTSYCVRIRYNDGTFVIKTLVTNAGATNTVLFETVIAAASAPSIGDLYTFGEADSESLECLVLSIQPGSDLSAQLTLVPYSPAIYTADSGEIPEFDNKLTAPDDQQVAPSAPTIINVRSDGTVLLAQTDGTFTNRILLTVAPVSGYISAASLELQYRIQNETTPEENSEEFKVLIVPADQAQIWISPVEELRTYELKLRYIGIDGSLSAWTETSHLVIGKVAPPQDIASITGVVRGVEGIKLSWSEVTDKDLSKYEVRVGSTWADGTVIFSGLALSYLWEVQSAATYHVMVKAVDTSGNKSTTEASNDVVISAPGAVQSLTAQVVESAVLVAWAAPATGSLPVKHYEIRKGATFATADVIGVITGTFYSINEAEIDEYTYWVVAVDQAGNVGTEDSVNASITIIAVTGTADTPATPTVLAYPYAGTIYVQADKQTSLAGQYFYHVQVSGDEIDWYAPGLDGSDWKTGSSGGYGTSPGEIYAHTDIPPAGTEASPTGRTLYYRMRRVKAATPNVESAWSASVSASTRPLTTKDIVAASITADKLSTGLLNALIAQINSELVVSSDYGWVAGNYTSPESGDERAYLSTNELRMQVHDGTDWVDKIFLGKSGSEWLIDISGREIVKLTNTTDYAGAVPNVADCAIYIQNVFTTEAANRQAQIQFNVNGGTHNRVGSVGFISESASDRKLSFVICTDSGTARSENFRINGNGLITATTDTSGSPNIDFKSLNGTLRIFAGYTNDEAYIEAGNAGWTASNKLNFTGYNGGDGEFKFRGPITITDSISTSIGSTTSTSWVNAISMVSGAGYLVTAWRPNLSTDYHHTVIFYRSVLGTYIKSNESYNTVLVQMSGGYIQVKSPAASTTVQYSILRII